MRYWRTGSRTGIFLPATIVLVLAMLAPASADELTQRIQKDLVALGYDPGTISGEVTTDTTIAIAKFQAERDIPVTGEVSPVLAGILSAAVRDLGLTEDEVAACQNPEIALFLAAVTCEPEIGQRGLLAANARHQHE